MYDRRFVVVSFFTSEYLDHALRLISSLDNLNIPRDVHGVMSKGSWIANVGYKAEFCRDKLKEHNMPIVWIDCDAEVMRYPDLFNAIKDEYDIGVFYRNRARRPNELLSGTVYFNNTEGSRKILDAWVESCVSHPETWDQRCLQEVLYEMRGEIKIFEFPCSYVRIFDAIDMAGVDPVILHHQASRELKRIVQ